jgi:hypothetical protein
MIRRHPFLAALAIAAAIGVHLQVTGHDPLGTIDRVAQAATLTPTGTPCCIGRPLPWEAPRP